MHRVMVRGRDRDDRLGDADPLDGPGSIDVGNDTFTVHNPLDLAPAAKLPVLIAALGPVMRANRILGEAEISPNCQRMLEHGDAENVGGLCGRRRGGHRRPRPGEHST